MRSFALAALLASSLLAQSLERTIEIALEQSPMLAAKKEQVRLGELKKKEARASMLGHIDGFGAYTRYNSPRTLEPLAPPIQPNTPTSDHITSIGANLEVPLFRGFADIANLHISKLEAKSSEIEYSLTKEQLIYNIKSLYFKGLGLLDLLDAQKAHIEALEALKKKVEKEIALGKKAPIDALKIESELLRVESDAKQTANAIEALKAHIEALSAASFDGFEPASESPKETKETPLAIKKLELAVERSKKAQKKARALYFPQINLKADYLKNYAVGEDAEVWQAGLNLGYRLFDFGYRSAQYEKSKVLALMASHNLEAQKRSLDADIKDANLQIKTLQSRIAALRSNVRLTKKIAEVERIKYESGRSDITDYLQALANEKQSLGMLAQTRYELYTKIAYLNYLKADR
jgi:outer membrane protein TolC